MWLHVRLTDKKRSRTHSGIYATGLGDERISLPGSKNIFITTSGDGKPGLERKKLRSRRASELSILGEIFSISSPSTSRTQAQSRRRPRHAGHVDQSEAAKLDVWEDEGSETYCEEDTLAPTEKPLLKTSSIPGVPRRTSRSRARETTDKMGQRPCFVREHVSRPPTPFRQEPIHLATGLTQPLHGFIGADRSHQFVPIPAVTAAQNNPPFSNAGNAPDMGPPFAEFQQPHISTNHAWNTDTSHLSQPSGPYMMPFMQPPPFFPPCPRDTTSQYFDNHGAQLPNPAPSFVYLGEGQTGTIGAQKPKSSSSIVHDQCIGVAEREAPATSDISRRIQHVHTCAGCGKKRSKDYQAAHPLRRGEIPQKSYCLRCIKEAEAWDLPASSTRDRGTRNKSQHQESRTVRGHTKTNDRSTSRGFLGTMLSSVLHPRPSHRRKSLSSAEESSSRLSSHEHSIVVRRRERPRRRNGDRDYNGRRRRNGEATTTSAAHSPRAAAFRNVSRGDSPQALRSARNEHTRDSYHSLSDDGEHDDRGAYTMPLSRADGLLASNVRDTDKDLRCEARDHPTAQASCLCGGAGVETGTAANHATEPVPEVLCTVSPSDDLALGRQHSHCTAATEKSGIGCQEVDKPARHNRRVLMPEQLAAEDVDLCKPFTRSEGSAEQASSIGPGQQQVNPDGHGSSKTLYSTGLESQETPVCALHACGHIQSLISRSQWIHDAVSSAAVGQQSSPSSTRAVYQQPSIEGRPSVAALRSTNSAALQGVDLMKNGGTFGQAALSAEHQREARPSRKTHDLARDNDQLSSSIQANTSRRAPTLPHSRHDKIIEDSLDGFHSGLEYKAEKQAEDELVNAGTNFDEQHSWSGSATSQSAVSSILTASVVSIESYTSEDELSSQCRSPHGSYEFVEESDGEDSRLTANEDLARGVFGHVMLRERTVLTHIFLIDGRRLRTSGVPRRQITSFPHERRSSRQMLRLPSSSPDDFFGPSSSSLVVHSGHSSEHFGINMERLRERLGGRLFRRRTLSRTH